MRSNFSRAGVHGYAEIRVSADFERASSACVERR